MQNHTSTSSTRRPLRRLALAAVVFGLLAAIAARAGSDPQLAVLRGDSQRTGRAKYACTYDPQLVWSYAAGVACTTSPVVAADGTAYYGGPDRFLNAVAPAGNLAWRFKANNIITATAAIALDGSIYFATSAGAFYALNPDGTAKWPAPFSMGTQGVSGSVLVTADGGVYFGSDNKYVYSVRGDGTLRWSYCTGGKVRFGLSTSPDGSVIYASADDGRLYAIRDFDGKLLWKSDPVSLSNLCAVGDDGTIYVGGTDCKIYAFDPEGNIKWTFRAFDKISTAAAIGLDGTIYFGSQDNQLYAVNPNGTLKWKRSSTLTYAPPTIDPYGSLLVAGYYGDLMAVNANDGSLLWKRTIAPRLTSTPVIGRGGSIYVLDCFGELFRLEGPVVPEPGSLAALGGALCAAGVVFLRRKQRQ